MTDQFRNITFPAEDDGFFAELREEVNAYFKNNGKSIYCLLYTSPSPRDNR